MIKRYEVLVDNEWYGLKATEEEYKAIQEDIQGELNTGYNVLLENGEVVETGIIDDIRKEVKFINSKDVCSNCGGKTSDRFCSKECKEIYEGY